MSWKCSLFISLNQLCEYTKTTKLYIKKMNFMACELYLKKKNERNIPRDWHLAHHVPFIKSHQRSDMWKVRPLCLNCSYLMPTYPMCTHIYRGKANIVHSFSYLHMYLLHIYTHTWTYISYAVVYIVPILPGLGISLYLKLSKLRNDC